MAHAVVIVDIPASLQNAVVKVDIAVTLPTFAVHIVTLDRVVKRRSASVLLKEFLSPRK
ncbi:hypothetical protein BofuT4_uP037510.1 [Botrytis cinerea T4]|uniref:Uncharacterized protein n=1 Tax=Botryotinia fuckeliana (strain T4) TaxID=999810 RepID=G2Y531_BOTF4|nr:hypothetical protein BofuT4_uP037510.1 [Botrytis cinerea T4]